MQGVEERIRLLRQDFRRRMIANHATLTACLHQSGINGTLATSDAAGLREVAHQLAGAGGTFGFAEVSRAASAVQTLAEEALARPEQMDALGAKLAAALRSLIIALEAAQNMDV